jgi:hypothetical protein
MVNTIPEFVISAIQYRSLLLQVGRMFLQAVYFPVRTLYLMSSVAGGTYVPAGCVFSNSNSIPRVFCSCRLCIFQFELCTQSLLFQVGRMFLQAVYFPIRTLYTKSSLAGGTHVSAGCVFSNSNSVPNT